MTDMRHIINILKTTSVSPVLESGGQIPYPFLYHVTRKENLPSIHEHGLQTNYYGTIHGQMDVHPPKPAIYLSRNRNSNNLNTALFDGSPLVVLKISTSNLDAAEIWPDDAIYTAFADEEIFTTSSQVSSAFGIGDEDAKSLLDEIESASDTELPLLLKPCWRWYLTWKRGGEIAYTTNISPNAIIGARDYGKPK